MRLFTLPALLAAALFSVVVVVPFLQTARTTARSFTLEVRMASNVAGVVKIYYDIGQGYRESDSAEQPLTKSERSQVYRFPLPAATYRSIRFDPIDGPGTVVMEPLLHITSYGGRLVRTVAVSELKPLDQIESVRTIDGKTEIVAGANVNDPQLVVMFSPSFTLGVMLRDLGMEILLRATGVFVALAGLLFACERRRLQTAAAAVTVWLSTHPRRAVTIVAGLSVVASSYPVVFLGKSHVSPNFGTTLLYEAYPSLPGYSSPRVVDPNGSDIGAAMWQHVPYSFVQHRALLKGEFPLWNRYNSAGTPLLAQGQSMFGDPLHFLVVLFDGASWAWDLKYLLAKSLFAAGLGFTVLALVGPPSLPAALLVTLAAPFIGFFVYRINHPAIFSLGYAPWVLYGWIRLAHSARRRSMGLSAAGLFLANFALLNSGTVKEACVLLLVMNFTGASILFSSPAPWRARLGRFAIAVWVGALVLLITTPVWATFFQTLRLAFTVSMHAAADQVQPSLLLGAFDELFFRPLSQEERVFNPSINFLLLLGLLYFLATLRVHFTNRQVMALAVCTLASMAFAFGVVPRGWIIRLPLFANVGHLDNTFLCGLSVLWSVLAGVGFATAATRLRVPEGRGDIAISAALLLALMGAWMGFHQASHRAIPGPGSVVSVMPSGQVIPIRPFIWHSLIFLLGSTIILAWIARHACRRRTMGPAGALLTALCVLVLLWRHGLHAIPVGDSIYVLQPPSRASFHAKSPAIDFVRAGQQASPARIFGLHGNVTPGWNAAYGLEAIYGPDALQNAWLRQLIDVSPVKWNSSWRLYLPAKDAGQARPFLDALNVRYYLDLKSDQKLLGRDLKLVRTADLDVYESPTAWPRAFFTDHLDTHADPADLMKKILARNGAPFASVSRDDVSKQPALHRLSQAPTTGTAAPATDYRLTENTTSFKVRASQPGMVVLTEAWWPDSFRASVDGRRVPLVRVNHAFKGVLIDTAGDHHVTFWYWPRNFLRNLILCGIGVALLGGSLFFALRPARTRIA